MTMTSLAPAESVELDEQLVERLILLSVVSAPLCASHRVDSSMNTIAGAFLRASLKSLRIRAAPRPANISTNDEALAE